MANLEQSVPREPQSGDSLPAGCRAESGSFAAAGRRAEGSRFSRLLRRWWKAVVLALLALACMVPALTGVPLHEWLGLVVAALLLVHCGVRVRRAGPMFRRGGVFRLGVVVDAALYLVLALCLVSGLLVSGTVLPALGLFAPGYFLWDPLHAFSAKLLLALLIVHGFLHWKALGQRS